MPLKETIVALSTPHGESALALIRLSGPQSHELTEIIFKPEDTLPRHAYLGSYRDLKGDELDTVVYTYYAKDASYTGEELLEISCHGNPFIVQKIIEDLIQRGCRVAEPGEFTRLAFLNGRMDLSQAEAVMDLIRARSDKALEAAKKQLSGSVRNKVNALTEGLLQVISHFEAYIDFPEEDLPPEDLKGPVRELTALKVDMERLITTSQYSDVLHEGIKTVIVGLPNVGKSSLLNALTGEERAIVSDEPGTTRDYIEERIMLDSYFLRVIDTAGLRESDSTLENLSMEKTREQLASADLKLLVIDSTAPFPLFPDDILRQLDNGRTLVLENKMDLPDSKIHEEYLPASSHCRISALTGEGITDVEKAMVKILTCDIEVPTPDTIIVSARHANALGEAKNHLYTAIEKIRHLDPIELIVSDLRESVDALSGITGKIDNEAILDKLFNSFCIGK